MNNIKCVFFMLIGLLFVAPAQAANGGLGFSSNPLDYARWWWTSRGSDGSQPARHLLAAPIVAPIVQEQEAELGTRYFSWQELQDYEQGVERLVERFGSKQLLPVLVALVKDYVRIEEGELTFKQLHEKTGGLMWLPDQGKILLNFNGSALSAPNDPDKADPITLQDSYSWNDVQAIIEQRTQVKPEEQELLVQNGSVFNIPLNSLRDFPADYSNHRMARRIIFVRKKLGDQ